MCWMVSFTSLPPDMSLFFWVTFASAKLPCSADVLSTARSMVLPPAKIADRSWVKVFAG